MSIPIFAMFSFMSAFLGNRSLLKFCESKFFNTGNLNFVLWSLDISERIDYLKQALPTFEDLNGAVAALLRLQDTYHLETGKMASGDVGGVKTSILTGRECFLMWSLIGIVMTTSVEYPLRVPRPARPYKTCFASNFFLFYWVYIDKIFNSADH